MWQAPGEGRRWALTVCPSRVLSENPEATELVEWFLGSTRFEGMTGAASGPPEWPFRGGYWRQPARLVQAVKLLRGEWAMAIGEREKKPAPTGEERPRR